MIEAQRNIITGCQDVWDKLVQEGLSKISETIPELVNVSSQLTELEINLNEAKEAFEDLMNKQNEVEYNLAIKYNSKLMELLNKY